MKKLIIITFCITVFFSLVKAQTLSVGSKWYYGIKSLTPPGPEGCTTYEAIADTIIQNDTFVKIYSYPDIYYCLQQQGEKIYYWMNNKKYLLFDANIKKGDTISIDAFFKYGNKDTAVSVRIFLDTVFYLKNNLYNANDTLKIFRVKHVGTIFSSYFDGGYFTKKIIKSIYFDNFFISIFNFPTTGTVSISFRCFNSPNYNYKDSALGTKPCDFSNVGVSDVINDNKIEIYPNPNNGSFTVLFADNQVRHIQVYDVLGNLVSAFVSADENATINLPDNAKGIYFISVHSDNGKFNSKIVVE